MIKGTKVLSLQNKSAISGVVSSILLYIGLSTCVYDGATPVSPTTPKKHATVCFNHVE